jgi:SAM-dependent methyltransferase
VSTLAFSAASPAAVTDLRAYLAQLYREELALTPENGYLREHAQPRFIDGTVRMFEWYRAFLPTRGRVLDWGCQHGPDSCLLRATTGSRLDLYACDTIDPSYYPVFRQAAGAAYAQLRHPVELPFEDNQFDAVIASGVLEHVPRDEASLGELYRILKPQGVLVITYLPNRASLAEWYRRVVRQRDFHRRLYGRAETLTLLKRNGFYPQVAEYQVAYRERWLGSLNRVVGPAFFAVDGFSSCHRVIAHKVECM